MAELRAARRKNAAVVVLSVVLAMAIAFGLGVGAAHLWNSLTR